MLAEREYAPGNGEAPGLGENSTARAFGSAGRRGKGGADHLCAQRPCASFRPQGAFSESRTMANRGSASGGGPEMGNEIEAHCLRAFDQRQLDCFCRPEGLQLSSRWRDSKEGQ